MCPQKSHRTHKCQHQEQATAQPMKKYQQSNTVVHKLYWRPWQQQTLICRIWSCQILQLLPIGFPYFRSLRHCCKNIIQKSFHTNQLHGNLANDVASQHMKPFGTTLFNYQNISKSELSSNASLYKWPTLIGQGWLATFLERQAGP